MRNRSNRNADHARDFFTPSGSKLEYIFLGPAFRDAAPTKWVSMPVRTAGGLGGDCFWGGIRPVCNMAGAFKAASNGEEGSAATAARRLEGGAIELHADISLQTLFTQRIWVFPEHIEQRISEDQLTKTIPATMVLDGHNRIVKFDMDGVFEGEGSDVEVREQYDASADPRENELPKLPDDGDVTELRSDKEIEEFESEIDKVLDSSS
jgi:hypothetical protein